MFFWEQLHVAEWACCLQVSMKYVRKRNKANGQKKFLDRSAVGEDNTWKDRSFLNHDRNCLFTVFWRTHEGTSAAFQPADRLLKLSQA